jgi:hypothetical protein
MQSCLRFVWMLTLALSCAMCECQSLEPLASGGGMEIQLEPLAVQDGLPMRFAVLLVNISGHELRLPQPYLECADSISGFIFLRARYAPTDPSKHALGRGCVADELRRPIAERVKNWKTLKAGESLRFEMNLTDAVPDAPGAGSYTIWADFTPAWVSAEDLQTLHRDGLDVLTEKIQTVPMHYEVSAVRK